MARRLLLAVVAFLGLSSSAFAARCDAPAGADPRLAEISASERLDFLRHEIDREAGRSDLWREAWTGGLGAAIVGTVAVGATDPNPVRRVDSMVSVTKTLVPIVQMNVAPPLVIRDARTLRAPGAIEDPCVALARAEALLVRDAHNEAGVYRWRTHLLPLAANILIAAALGTFLDDNWTPALLGLGAGLVVNEIRMWSQPRDLLDTLERYRAGNLAPSRRAARWTVAPSLARGVPRLTVRFAF